jgi:hypothetical protein
MSELTDDELLDELGVEAPVPTAGRHTQLEERIIAGFEDILRFYRTHGRAPRHGVENDIFERLYAVRLDRIRQLPQAPALLADLDTPGLLRGTADASPNVSAMDADALLGELEVTASPTDSGDITVLHHVRSEADRLGAEEIADRKPCKDFEHFRELFDAVHSGLKTNTWLAKTFVKDASIEVGDFFIVGGHVAYVAAMHNENSTRKGQFNPRLRVIFDNKTESDMLLLSLVRALYPDGNKPAGRRLIDLNKIKKGSLFEDEIEPDDIASGTIYVLRSLSDDPFISSNRELIHKIGVTGGKVETRIANAQQDATYLLAKVEVVASYSLHNINRTKLEHIFHKLFGAAQLDVKIQDRFGRPVKPKEWFLVPLPVINEAVQRIIDGSITKLVYDPEKAQLVSAKI